MNGQLQGSHLRDSYPAPLYYFFFTKKGKETLVNHETILLNENSQTGQYYVLMIQLMLNSRKRGLNSGRTHIRGYQSYMRGSTWEGGTTLGQEEM